MVLNGIWDDQYNCLFDNELEGLPNRTGETENLRVVWVDSLGIDSIVFDLQVSFLRFDLPACQLKMI